MSFSVLNEIIYCRDGYCVDDLVIIEHQNRYWFLGAQIALAMGYGNLNTPYGKKIDSGISSFISFKEIPEEGLTHIQKDIHYINLRLKKQREPLLNLLKDCINDKLFQFLKSHRLVLVSKDGLENWVQRRPVDFVHKTYSKIVSFMSLDPKGKAILSYKSLAEQTHNFIACKDPSFTFAGSRYVTSFNLANLIASLPVEEEIWKIGSQGGSSFITKGVPEYEVRDTYTEFLAYLNNQAVLRSPYGDEEDPRPLLTKELYYRGCYTKKATDFDTLNFYLFNQTCFNHFIDFLSHQYREVKLTKEFKMIEDYWEVHVSQDSVSVNETTEDPQMSLVEGWLAQLPDNLPSPSLSAGQDNIAGIAGIEPNKIKTPTANKVKLTSVKVDPDQEQVEFSKFGFLLAQGFDIEDVAKELNIPLEKAKSTFEKVKGFALGYGLGQGKEFDKVLPNCFGMDMAQAKAIAFKTKINPDLLLKDTEFVSAKEHEDGSEQITLQCFCGKEMTVYRAAHIGNSFCLHGDIGKALKSLFKDNFTPEQAAKLLNLREDKVIIFYNKSYGKSIQRDNILITPQYPPYQDRF